MKMVKRMESANGKVIVKVDEDSEANGDFGDEKVVVKVQEESR